MVGNVAPQRQSPRRYAIYFDGRIVGRWFVGPCRVDLDSWAGGLCSMHGEQITAGSASRARAGGRQSATAWLGEETQGRD